MPLITGARRSIALRLNLASACPGWIEPYEPEAYDHSTAGATGGSPLAPSSFYLVANPRENKTTKTEQKNHLHSYLYKTGWLKDSVPDGRWIDSVAGRDFFQLPNRICQSPDDIFLLSDCICRVENRLVLLPFDH